MQAKTVCVCGFWLWLIVFCQVTACRKHDTTPSRWSGWKESDTPVFRGQYPLVGDPSVLRDGGLLRMFYTGFDPYRNPQGPEICGATSADGFAWTNIPSGDSVQGRILYTAANAWSTAHETSFALKWNGKYYLWFIGYRDSGAGVFGSGPVSIGLATATDGIHFTSLPDPVLVSTPGGPDGDALSSPSVCFYNDSLLMIYAGYCYTVCGPSVTASLLAATSADRIHWIKRATPVISSAEIPWASRGLAEPELVKGPDSNFYLFMTSVNEPQVIGVAKSSTPFGPWDVNPAPLIRADKSFSSGGAVAPSVLIENNLVRMWYHGFSSGSIRIGYAEAAWPLKN